MNLEVYVAVSDEVKDFLCALGGIRVTRVPHLTGKKDFGDVDFVVWGDDTDKMSLVCRVKELGWQYKLNSDMVSFLYKNTYSVDVIYAYTYVEYCHLLFYLSYGYLGQFLGYFVTPFGFLKYDRKRGLLHPVSLNGLKKLDVSFFRGLDHFIEESLLLLDLRRKEEFNDVVDIVKWLSTSKFFNPVPFRKFIGKRSEERFTDIKESVFSFLDSFEKDKKEVLLPTRTHFLSRFERMFPENSTRFQAEIGRYFLSFEEECRYKDKFNGSIVKELTGLKEGKLLGDFIVYFKDRFCSDIHKDFVYFSRPEFKDLILSASREYIRESVLFNYKKFLEKDLTD